MSAYLTDEEIMAMREKRPVRNCFCCGEIVDYRVCMDMKVNAPLCRRCARDIANAYAFNYVFYGKWLDYPNRPEIPSPRKKKKITHSLQKKVWERDKYRCVHCGTHLDLCVDHIVPESKGGTLDLNNLQTLCRRCNSKKGTT